MIIIKTSEIIKFMLKYKFLKNQIKNFNTYYFRFLSSKYFITVEIMNHA